MLIWVLAVLAITLTSGGLYTFYITGMIKPDAETINRLGIIRGSIQRLVKIEISGIDSGELANNVDEEIKRFYKRELLARRKRAEIKDAVEEGQETQKGSVPYYL